MSFTQEHRDDIALGLSVVRFSDTKVRVLFDYGIYAVELEDVRELSDELKFASSGSLLVGVSGELLGVGIIDMEFNPIKAIDQQFLDYSIKRICDVILEKRT